MAASTTQRNDADADAWNFCEMLYQFSCFDFFPTPQASHELTVDGVSADRFLTAFTWDEAKHPARRPLRETVDKLQESVAKVDDEFKVKTSEYAMVKSQLNGLTRKAGGSLATRDLGELVQGADVRPQTPHIVFESITLHILATLTH